MLVFPALNFGQNFTGNYRAVFFNLFSEPRAIVAEFEVRPDNSIVGRVKVGDEVKELTGAVDKKGKFEASSEKQGNAVYKLKGKFDKDNKISFIERLEKGSGLNKSVSENGFDGTFAKFALAETKVETSSAPLKPAVELIDNGKSWLRIQHSNPMFGTDWTDFIAQINFGSNAKNTINTADTPDYFNLSVKSKAEELQILRLNVQRYTPDKKVWKGNEFRSASYREVNGSARNSFIAGAMMQTDPLYLDGTLEIVKETETQIVFKISNFKIKRLAKDEFVELNGFIYVNRAESGK